MQTRDNQVQSVNICQKLFNFFGQNFLSRGLKRLTSAPPQSQNSSTRIPIDVHLPNPLPAYPDHSEILHPSHDTIHVHFKHGEDEHSEPWTRLDHGLGEPLGSSVNIGETKDERNPGKVRQKGGVGNGKRRKTVRISDGRKDREEEDKKGTKKLPINTAVLLGEKLPLVIDPRDEEELDGRILRPHLISVASNINEKSDEFIKTRIAAMQDKQ